ncbi:MAG: methionyl-tRNA formyltransferase [Anaeroplasmataceae bacterium]
MKIIYMGTPSFSVKILESLNEKYEVVMVVTQPDKITGRKKELMFSPVKKRALELGINVFQPINIRKEFDIIKACNADILVTAAYGQILPLELLNSFKKCINVHASLLPQYRGGAPIQRSIMNGDLVTGISIIEMVEKMDAGKIFAQKDIEIDPSINSDNLFALLSNVGNDLLLDVIDDIYNNKLLGVPQDESKVTFAKNIKREEEKINFNLTSQEVHNQIRGLSTNPGAFFIINEEVIKVYESKIVDEYGQDQLPGTILCIKGELIIKTKDKAISLTSIKPSGKKTMLTRDFLNGQKLLKLNDVCS